MEALWFEAATKDLSHREDATVPSVINPECVKVKVAFSGKTDMLIIG